MLKLKAGKYVITNNHLVRVIKGGFGTHFVPLYR